VEHSNFRKQNYRNATSLSLSDFRTQRFEQGLDVTPLDVSASEVLEDNLESSPVLALHRSLVPLFGTNIKRIRSTASQTYVPANR
jgi:hypothetical protein